MRHKLRLCLRQLGELVLERVGNMAMQFLPPRPQQARIRCVLQQGVLEGVGGIRWLAAAEDQSSERELLKRRLQCNTGKRRNGREHKEPGRVPTPREEVPRSRGLGFSGKRT